MGPSEPAQRVPRTRSLVTEVLGAQLATLHNLHFYLSLMRDIRAGIAEGSFPEQARAMGGAWA